MPWAPVRFKGQEILAEVDAQGALVVEGGRVRIRWSDRPGARIYRGSARRLERLEGPVRTIDDGSAPPGSGSGGGTPGTPRIATGALPPGTAVAYTDGACSGNPGPAGSGVLLMLPDGRVAEAIRSLGHATNNIAELQALDTALDLLDEAGLPPEAPVRIHTDSSYCIGVLARGWKAKKNTARIAALRERLQARPGVELAWVRGHDGDPGNERADALARKGARGITATDWSGGPR